MKTLILFIGCYTQMLSPNFGGHGDGIYCFRFYPESGQMELLHVTPTVNPSYLKYLPETHTLYAVNEMPRGETFIEAYEVLPDFSLKKRNAQPIPGAYPCHLEASADADRLIVACYGSGNLASFLVEADGSLGPCLDQLQQTGSSINKERQEGPHAHMVQVDPTTGKIYSCNLGADKVFVYQKDAETNKLVPLEEEDIILPPGSGPRHMVFHPSGQYAFVISELNGEVSVLEKQEGKFHITRSVSSLAKNFEGPAASAAIRMHPNGRWLYTSNRNPDEIVQFKFNPKNGKLKRIASWPSGGNTPRDFNLTPDGSMLIVAHQDSDDMGVYSIDPGSGKLTEVSRTSEALSPTCVVVVGESSW